MIERSQVEFELGFDLFRYGQPAPKEFGASSVEGWRAAEVQLKGKPRTLDRDVLRWFQLRRNALKRSVYFDKSVTPEYLRSISVERCWVTGRTLTTATGTETDGSIDRILNDYGYTQGNIVMISVEANKSKGRLSLDEVKEQANCSVPSNGLDRRAWRVIEHMMEIATESHAGTPRKYLNGEIYINGLPYALSARLQALMLSTRARYFENLRASRLSAENPAPPDHIT